MVATMTREMTLRETVRACVASGVTDPDAIAARVDVREAGEELIHEIVREAVASMVGQDQTRVRNSWKAESVRPSAVNAENAARSAKARVDRLFVTWIVSGTPLGKCDKAALDEAAALERCSAKGHLVNAAFYDAVSARLKAKKTVDQCMDEKEAKEILRKVQSV